MIYIEVFLNNSQRERFQPVIIHTPLLSTASLTSEEFSPLPVQVQDEDYVPTCVTERLETFLCNLNCRCFLALKKQQFHTTELIMYT